MYEEAKYLLENHELDVPLGLRRNGVGNDSEHDGLHAGVP
jgi:hypothetical protein